MRESIVMKVIHCGTTEMADAWLKLAWSIRDKGPVESQYHEVHNQVPCPTASSKMYQKLYIRDATVVTAGLGVAGLPVCL